MPSSSRVKRALLSQKIPQQKIYELGSGWGGVAFLLASHFPNSQVVAYEISPLPWMVSKMVQRLKKRPNLQLYKKDFFKESLESADLIYCYLCPKLMERLKPKLEKELKPDCRIISNTFSLPGWVPEGVIESDDLWHSKLYLYRKM